MADPLSIASGAAGIITLAGAVISTFYQYGCAVKDAPLEIRSLLNELTNLTGVLSAVKAMAEADTAYDSAFKEDRPPPYSENPASAALGDLKTSLFELKMIIEDIAAVLKRAEIKHENRLGRAIKRLTWPLQQKDTMDLMAKLERHKTIFVIALSGMDVMINLDIRDTVKDIARIQQEERLNRLREDKNAQMREVFQWLCPIDPVQAYEKGRKLRLPGTGKWLFNDSGWMEWLESEESFFWLYGIPGSGKTVVMSSLLEKCLSQPQKDSSGLAFFYCDFRDQESQKAKTIIGSIICQLSSYRNETFSSMSAFARKYRTSSGQLNSPHFADLEQLYRDVASDFKHITLAIDGLDECSNRTDLLSWLKRLSSLSTANVKILVSSREERDIKEAFIDFKHQSTRVSAVDDDVDAYISSSIARSKRLQLLPPDIQNLVRVSLRHGAHGMFRWVQCQIQELERLRTTRDVRNALNKLPRDLYETYERILERIDDSEKGIARRALTWLSYTNRPLMLNELAEAVVITKDTKAKDPEAAWYPQDLLHIIGSLVLYTEEDSLVVLAHYSVKNFLESKHILSTKCSSFYFDSFQAHENIASYCLTYMLMEDFAGGVAGSSEAFSKRLTDYSLLAYAARFWPFHGGIVLSQSKEVLRLACKLLHPSRTPHFWTWLEVLVSAGYYSFRAQTQTMTFSRQMYWHRVPKNLAPLYYASSYGLYQVVEWLINQGVDLNGHGGRYGGTALHAAVFRNHVDVVKLLIESGADPEEGDDNRMTAIQLMGSSHVPDDRPEIGEAIMRKLLSNTEYWITSGQSKRRFGSLGRNHSHEGADNREIFG